MKQITRNTVSMTKRTDNFNRFFNDLKTRNTDMPHEQQVALIKHYQTTGCITSRNKVVEANLLFCAKCAKAYTMNEVTTMSFNDLLSVATEAIIHAIDKFDTTTGYKLISYAVMWIRQKITIYIQAKTKVIKLHSHSATIYNTIKRLKEKGTPLTPQSILEEVQEGSKRKFTLESIRDVMTAMYVDSTDRNLHENAFEPMTHLDKIQDESLMPDIGLDDGVLSRQVEAALNRLKPRERKTIIMRYGIGGSAPCQLDHIAEEFGLTREAVRQIELRAKRKLAVYLKKGMQAKLF